MGKLKDDQIKWVLDLDAKGVQSELKEISSDTNNLTTENKALQKEMKETERWIKDTEKALDKMGERTEENAKQYDRAHESYSQLTADLKEQKKQFEENEKKIEDNKKKFQELEKTLKVEDMTMNQLKKRAKELQKQLDNTSESATPEKYKQLDKELGKVKNRMGELRNSGQSTQNMFSRFTGSVNKYWAAVVAGIAIAKGAFETFRSVMESNQSTGDQLRATMDGVSNALQYLKVSAAQMDFSNLIEGLMEAYNIGKEVHLMLDELFERQNSFKLLTLPEQKEIEELKTQLRDVTLTNEERIAIGDKIIEKTKAIADMEKDIAAQEVEAHKKKLVSQTKMTDAEMEYFITQYEHHREEINFAQKVLSAEENIRKIRIESYRVGSGFVPVANGSALSDEADRLQKNVDLMKKSKDFSDEAYESLKKYNRTNDEMVKNYVDAQSKYLEIDNKTTTELRRTRTTISSLIKAAADEEERNQRKTESDQRKAVADAKRAHELILQEIEAVHQEDMAKIRKRYADGKIKTEAELQKELYAQEQAYYALREAALEEMIESTTNKEVKTPLLRKLSESQNKRLEQEAKFRQQLEKIIMDADPVKREEKRYTEQLAAAGINERSVEALRLAIAEEGDEKRKDQLSEQLLALEVLEKQHQDNLFNIGQQSISRREKQFEDSFKERRSELQQEIQDQQGIIQMQRELGALSDEALFEAEAELQHRRIRMIEEEIEARTAAGLTSEKLILEMKNQEQNLTKTYTSEFKRRSQLYGSFASEIGDVLGNALTGNEDALRSSLLNVVNMGLDLLKAQVQMSIVAATAQALAQPDSVATFGAAGLARAAVLTALIEGAFSAAKTVIANIFPGANTSSKTTSETTTGTRVVNDGFAAGGFNDAGTTGGYTGDGDKYDVRGVFENGKPYHAGEYVVAQEEMKHPVVVPMVRQIEAIRLQRTNKNALPAGFADGGYNGKTDHVVSGFPVESEILVRLCDVLEDLRDNPITADVNYRKLEKVQQRMESSRAFAAKR